MTPALLAGLDAMVQQAAPSLRGAAVTPEQAHSALSDAKGKKTSDGQVLVQHTDPLPDDMREAARMLKVRDVDRAWTTFTGSRSGQWVMLAGAWQAYCARWAGNEENDRNRATGANGHAKAPPGATSRNGGRDPYNPGGLEVASNRLTCDPELAGILAERAVRQQRVLREREAKRHAENRAAVEAELATAAAALGSRTRLQVEQAIGGGHAVAVDSVASHGPANGISEIMPKTGVIAEIQSGVKVAVAENTEE